MEITYNNLTTSEQIVCLTGVPNILRFTGSSTEDIKAEWDITFNIIGQIDPTKVYNIFFGDYSITSTYIEENVGGTTFFLPQFDQYEQAIYASYTIAKALKNVPYIGANYDVWLDDNTDGSMSKTIRIKAKEAGKRFNVDITTDLPQNVLNIHRGAYGSTNDAMLQGKSNKILCDIYRYTEPAAIGEAPDRTKLEFVTSLEKNYYGGEVNFDLTPVLSSLIKEDDYNDVEEWYVDMYGFSDKRLVFTEQTSPMYIVRGYLCNFSQPFLNRISGHYLAANVSRGDDRDSYNKTHLYVFEPSITFSLYSGTHNGQVAALTAVDVSYIDSSGTAISETEEYVAYDGNVALKDYYLPLDEELLRRSTYVDIWIPTVGSVRYDVIKPINGANATEERRVYWLNEYGGISFFDFTGARSETRKETIEYYDKQDYSFYDEGNAREKSKVYAKKIDIEVKHSSHYIDKNGTYLFYSLQNAKTAWIELGGTRYYINVTNLEISEGSNTSHIYTANISYNYSRPDIV